MRVAAIQLNSSDEVDRNLEGAERLVRAAAAAGAELVVLPEKWSALAPGAVLKELAEPLDGPIVTACREWAGELGVSLVAGSVSERVPGREQLAEHLGADRCRRRDRRRLSQDPHVRRRRRRGRLSRVRARAGG